MGERRVIIYAIIVAFVVVSGIIYTISIGGIEEESLVFDENMNDTISDDSVDTELETQNMICVQLCGEVENEGIYNVPEGSRVYEVVALAGGLTNEAADNVVNQAREVKDGEMLDFPSQAEVESGLYGSNGGTQLISINTATMEQLMTLPGIGESKAESIIRYREENNGFDTIEEIMEVDGIKEALFEQIEPLISI
jgi:competence protein ComEA